MKQAIAVLLMLVFVMTLSACSNPSGDKTGSSKEQSANTVSQTSGDHETQTSLADNDASVDSTVSHDASAIQATGALGQAATNAVQYSDGNSYVLTDDRHFIIKIDPKFRGYEIMYEAPMSETTYEPVYRNGYLYFGHGSGSDSYQISRINVKTKKVTTIFRATSLPDYQRWTIIEDKIFLETIKEGGVYCTVWSCNLDGSGLKKTSAVDVASLSFPVFGYNHKIYAVNLPLNTNTVVFYEMNFDGTGFHKIFSHSHHQCESFWILAVNNGYIYYSADAFKQSATGCGVFAVKTNGNGWKKLINVPRGGAAFSGNSLYVPDNDLYKGICRIDSNLNVIPEIALKNVGTSDLINLYNGFLFADGQKKNYLLSLSSLKAYPISDYSPPSPFAKYVNGFNLISLPQKSTYKVGEGFDSTGFKHFYYAQAVGTLTERTDYITFTTSDGVKLTQGRPFTQAGKKTIQIRFNGSVKATYDITVTADSNNLKDGVNILSYPTKTQYKVGEGFDISGFRSVYYENGNKTDIHDKITFYTSGTVQLTQGRPFTTAGKKVVEIRYNGKKVSSYTIVVVA